MAKFIYAPTLQKLKAATAFPNILSDDDPSYRAIAITADGYLTTHGKSFKFIDIADASNKLLASTLDGTKWIDAPTADKQILKWDATNSKFIWSTSNDFDTRYKININGTLQSNTQNIENDWGSIYAPTNSGTGIPSLNGTSWTYNNIITNLNAKDSEDNYLSGIPTAEAVRTFIGTEFDNFLTNVSGAFVYRGAVAKDPTTMAPTAQETPKGGWHTGDVIVCNNLEYVYDGTQWRPFGDEGSYLLATSKPIKSTGNGSLTIGNGEIGSLSGITINLSTITLSIDASKGVLTGITVDSYGRVSEVTSSSAVLTDTDARYTLITAAASNSTTELGSNRAWSSSNACFLNLIETINGTKSTTPADSIEFAASGDATLIFDAGKITIGSTTYTLDTGISITDHKIKNIGVTAASASYTGTGYDIGTLTYNGSTVTFKGHDTWRPIYAYTLDKSSGLAERMNNASTGAKALQFGSEFVWDEYDTGGENGTAEIHLAWAEVDANGAVTYSI